jgi:predicted nucleic acid-binding protein
VGPVGSYLDAGILVALLTVEPQSGVADAFIAAQHGPLIVSDLASAEFASALARRVRTGEATLEEARSDLLDFDVWIARSAQRVEISPADLTAATSFLRRLDLPLRTPDAIHIAVAQRLGAILVTFDRQMAVNARALRIVVTEP